MSLETAIDKITAQQPTESTPVWMVGEQLKDILRGEPHLAEIVERDLEIKEMSLTACEQKIKAFPKPRSGRCKGGEQMTIYCSCCGKNHSFKYSAQNVLHTVYMLGWGSYGSALCCPECTRTWAERNPGRPQPGPDNTIGAIYALRKIQRRR